MGLLEPLDSFPAEHREAVLQRLRSVRFERGECIFRQGDEGDGCYFIKSGEVRLELQASEHIDTERVLGHLSAGSLLGELALLDRQPRSATAYAETDVATEFLSLAAVEELCREEPRAGMAVVHALGRVAALKLRQYTAQLAEFLVPERRAPDIDLAVARANEAQRQLEEWPEDRVDALLFKLAQAVAQSAEPLARMTVQETRIGNVPDKITKNVHASLGVCHYLQGKCGHGIIGIDMPRRVTSIASAAGVVFAIIPVTNPVATAIFKALIAFKARCALILSFHRACLGAGNAVCEIMQKVLAENGAPDGLL
jgi:CRP-like cAMP-binding protein